MIAALVALRCTGDITCGEDDIQRLQFVSAPVAAAIERKQIEARLDPMARFGPLTDLPNRTLFRERLLDRFQEVDDQLGHAMGERLLCEVARRLSRCVRESECDRPSRRQPPVDDRPAAVGGGMSGQHEAPS